MRYLQMLTAEERQGIREDLQQGRRAEIPEAVKFAINSRQRAYYPDMPTEFYKHRATAICKLLGRILYAEYLRESMKAEGQRNREVRHAVRRVMLRKYQVRLINNLHANADKVRQKYRKAYIQDAYEQALVAWKDRANHGTIEKKPNIRNYTWKGLQQTAPAYLKKAVKQ